ncbi:MAG TPA: hypothetical protein VMB80_13405 [Candidatus Acidoferrum sp.]|nr:hypothetical protein [Candidatus Acidoferrum sp.]
MVPSVPDKAAEGGAVASRPGRAGLIFAGCLALLALVGWLDYLTGYELGFFVFYTAPVGLAAWHLGRWPGIGLALGATIAWWLADALAGAKYSSHFSFWWNSLVHFAAFVINAVTIAKIKVELRQRRELALELAGARRALRAAAEVLPVCPTCGKVRPQTGQNAATELRELARANTDLSGALCADCAQAARKS